MQDIYTLIDQYLNGELSDNERAKFEQRLKDDPTFAADFDLQRDLFQSLALQFGKEEEEIALRKTLKEASTQHFQAKPRGKVIRILFGVAAAAALLLLFILQPWQQPLFDQYYTAPPIALTSKGDDGKCDAAQFDEFYRAKRYQEVLPIVKACLVENPTDSELLLANGICLLETGQYLEARNILGQLFENETYKGDVIWFAALSHLKEGQKEKAKLLLQQVPKGSDHAEKAKELVERL